jgi:hypothetical protein
MSTQGCEQEVAQNGFSPYRDSVFVAEWVTISNLMQKLNTAPNVVLNISYVFQRSQNSLLDSSLVQNRRKPAVKIDYDI